MPRRTVLTERQRTALFALPADTARLERYYTLSEDDLAHVRRRRGAANRFGFALQLCALRFPGRLLQPDEVLPEAVLGFVGAQLDLSPAIMLGYGARETTRYQHSAALQQLYGFRPFVGQARAGLLVWLEGAAEAARSNDALAAAMLAELRQRRVIVPGPSTVERLCADALVAADRRIAERIASRLDTGLRARLLALLEETTERGISRFVWLRESEPGTNSADANRLLDRLEHLRAIAIPAAILDDVPHHRVARLRRQGERYFADGLRDLPACRRLAILAVCAVEWRATLTDAIVETHLRITGKLYRAAQKRCAEQAEEARGDVGDTLEGFAALGRALIAAKAAETDLGGAVVTGGGWDRLAALVDSAAALTGTLAVEPLDLVVGGHARMRRYTPRLLDALDLQPLPKAHPLLEAIDELRRLNAARDTALPDPVPTAFAQPKWQKRLRPGPPERRLWETAVLFSLADALRAGDVWLEDSRRYRSIARDLVPAEAAAPEPLGLPATATPWLEARRAKLEAAFERLTAAALDDADVARMLEAGKLHVDRPEPTTPEGADDLILALYRRVPLTRITDVLVETDDAVGFTQAFTDLRTGAPCRDRVGLLTAILADGINLGLKKMAAACETHGFWELLRIARWHIQEDAYARALAMLVEAQARLPFAAAWGDGTTASADGQFFPAGGMGEAMNLINAKYGQSPGLKAYTHVSDRFGPFATQAIPATAHEAPYILDGLLQCDAGRAVREFYADTGGFTDHVFGLAALLNIAFAPRIRDIASKRLYAFDPAAAPAALRPLIGGRLRATLIEQAWPDILRLVASTTTGAVAPSTMLRKLAAFPRQNALALALREVGRLERTCFIVEWILDSDLRQRAQAGLCRGEASQGLKRALSLGRQGEIRDRSSEGQHYRLAGLNLLSMAIIYWNTARLGDVLALLETAGEAVPRTLLRHVSPLAWEHITLTGEYRWPV